jgi:hypothetical protein
VSLYKVEQYDKFQPSPTRKEWWSVEARNVNGLTAAIELARVLRELRGRPTRVTLQPPPEPSLPISWERT